MQRKNPLLKLDPSKVVPWSSAPPAFFPPTRLGIEDARTATRDLDAIEVWKEAWLAALAGNAVAVAVPLLGVLREAFGATPPLAIRSLPYRVLPFPEPLGAAPVEDLRRVLLWRAGLVDFLADSWDTLGPSTFDMKDCLRVSALLRPSGILENSQSQTCSYCLVTHTRERNHFEECGVQRAWRR